MSKILRVRVRYDDDTVGEFRLTVDNSVVPVDNLDQLREKVTQYATMLNIAKTVHYLCVAIGLKEVRLEHMEEE